MICDKHDCTICTSIAGRAEIALFANTEYRFLFGVIGPGRLGVVDAVVKKRWKLARRVLEHAKDRISEMSEG